MYVSDEGLCRNWAAPNRIIGRFGLSSAFGHAGACARNRYLQQVKFEKIFAVCTINQ